MVVGKGVSLSELGTLQRLRDLSVVGVGHLPARHKQIAQWVRQVEEWTRLTRGPGRGGHALSEVDEHRLDAHISPPRVQGRKSKLPVVELR